MTRSILLAIPSNPRMLPCQGILLLTSDKQHLALSMPPTLPSTIRIRLPPARGVSSVRLRPGPASPHPRPTPNVTEGRRRHVICDIGCLFVIPDDSLGKERRQQPTIFTLVANSVSTTYQCGSQALQDNFHNTRAPKHLTIILTLHHTHAPRQLTARARLSPPYLQPHPSQDPTNTLITRPPTFLPNPNQTKPNQTTTMSASATHPLAPTLRALTFDLFGTAVDWRSSITTALTRAATTKLTSPTFPGTLPPATQTRLQSLTRDDWAVFAQAWRDAYSAFTRSFVPGTTPWQTIDAVHRASLGVLLGEWGLAGVYDEGELDGLSESWHFLEPWADVVGGMERLNGRFETASLSNGNRALLEDMNAYARLGLGRLISAEDFRAYKPSGEVYLGACRVLGLEPGQVAMVATHLKDLAAARGYGMRTVYVERPGEEEWKADEERFVQAREWVDVWVAEGEGGFEEVARRLGA